MASVLQNRTQSTSIHDENASDQLTRPHTTVDTRDVKTDTDDWRTIIQKTGPVWFAVPMGTGITGLLLVSLPWHTVWLYWLSVVYFCINALLFGLVTGAVALKCIMKRQSWKSMIADPVNCLFFGCMPIALATLVESWIFLCVPYWGYWSVVLAWIGWMIDTVLAVITTIGLSYILLSRPYVKELTQFTAVQILPIAATVVASGAAAESAGTLRNDEHAIGTLLTGYVLWGLSVPLAIVVELIYWQRLTIYKLPPPQIIASSLIPLGPLGMGGYSIMYLGRVARALLPRVQLLKNVPMAGDWLYLFGILSAIIMWSYGLLWLSMALLAMAEAWPFAFNMSWWSFTFPLAVYTLSTLTLGEELPSVFFRMLGTVFAVITILLWLLVFYKTVHGIYKRRLL